MEEASEQEWQRADRSRSRDDGGESEMRSTPTVRAKGRSDRRGHGTAARGATGVRKTNGKNSGTGKKGEDSDLSELGIDFFFCSFLSS